jgi:hypothetical protein
VCIRIAAMFRALARVRHGRAVHKVGRTFHATLTCDGIARSGIVLFDRPGIHPALVRLSRGAGLPSGWPDVLGVAIRVPDGAGRGADLDLLVSTALGRAPLARHIPFPRWAVGSTYTSIAGYRTRSGRRFLAVLPDRSVPSFPDLDAVTAAARAGQARFLVGIAARSGRWRVAGRIDLAEPLPAADDRQLAFDPLMTSVPGVTADGFLWRLRAAAYRESRRGRWSTPPTAERQGRPRSASRIDPTDMG